MFFPLASTQVVVVAGAALVGGALVSPRAVPDESDHLTISAGYFDLVKSHLPAAEFRLGYRWNPVGWRLRPLVGVMATSHGSTAVSAGIAYDLPIGPQVVVTPSFAPTLYSRGNGLDLGDVLEFRSQLEVACRVGQRSRIGVSFSHISNGNLGSTNVGAESLMLNYSWALR